jgi:hypothetical protein
MNAKQYMIETYSQGQRANDGRPTCAACHAPCGLTREYRGARLCDTCYNDEPVFTQKKELLPCQTLSSSAKAVR